MQEVTETPPNKIFFPVKFDKVLTHHIILGEKYGLMQENGDIEDLGILESIQQCGYAKGGKSFRAFFNNNGSTSKCVKAWNDSFIKL